MALRSQATVLIDDALFRQAFINLVQNAQQAIILPRDVNLPPGKLRLALRLAMGICVGDVNLNLRDDHEDGCGCENDQWICANEFVSGDVHVNRFDSISIIEARADS